MENNNDMKGVESLAAAVEYITKQVSKAEPKDDILVFLHEKLKKIETYDSNKTVIGKWMSLLISQNKKDVSIHQALWNLQGFDFMSFSDKFQKINLKQILDLLPKES